MKKIISLITLCILICSIFCSCAEKKELKPTEKFFVNDFANVIDQSDEDTIYAKAVQLNEKTTAQVVVVTVNDLGGEEPEDYALNLGRDWGVGDKEKNNGIVVLFSKDDRQIYIAVGYGLEGALPDSKTGRIIDTYGIDYLKANKFSKGLLSITNAVINEVYIEYGEEPEEGYTAIDNIAYNSKGETTEQYGKKVAVSWIIMAIVIFFVVFFGKGRLGFLFFGGPRGPGGFGGGGFSGGSGFGGFGGGGGFSGGGGSFGGGGAGRGF